MHRAALLLCLILGLLATSALAADMSGTLKASCTTCHSLGLVCDGLGKDQAYWDKTVVRMKASGADIQSADMTALAAWLAGLDKARSGFCK